MDEAKQDELEPLVGAAERQRAWLTRLADEFIKLEATMPVINFLPEDDNPRWVMNLEREIGSAMYSTAKLKQSVDLTPWRLGAIIGHQCAVAVWLMEWFDQELESPQTVDDASLTPEQVAAGEAFCNKLDNEWYPALRRLAKRAMCSSVDQSYPDMRDFLLAYAGAFANKPATHHLGSFGNSAFEIYNFMLLYWRIIARLDSVHQLHQVLVKVFDHRAGDLKRTEKMCQRIQLTYRKAGRPKKAR
jgi:hypothetical protein